MRVSEFRCEVHGAARHDDCPKCGEIIRIESHYTRFLCYKHHKSEFDKLPNARRAEAAKWLTVSEISCELCDPQRPAMRATVDNLPEVECQDCWWQGNSCDLAEGMLCPECGSDDICDYESE